MALRQYAIDIATGMNYLHLLKPPLLHRDLKSLNILLDEHLIHCKICDFGMSKMRMDQNQAMTIGVGTPIWMAPELMRGDKYDEKVDIYAFGIILYEMVSNDVPFKEMNQMQLLLEVAINNKRPIIPQTCPPPFRRLITDCWNNDPTQRPPFSGILKMLHNLPPQ